MGDGRIRRRIQDNHRSWSTPELASKALGGAITLGVCDDRCSILRDRSPMAWAWRGPELALTKTCPICGQRLYRRSCHTWAAPIYDLNGGRK